MKLLTVIQGYTRAETIGNRTTNKLEHEKIDKAKNNSVYILKERNHVYDHNPKGKCHNILQNIQMLTFSVLCSTNSISKFYSRIPYHLHNTAVIHSPLSHILPFFYVILHLVFFNDELVVSVSPIFGLHFLHIYHQ